MDRLRSPGGKPTASLRSALVSGSAYVRIRTDRRWPRQVYAVGSEPDPRFTFANERTFLAWIRTALGFLAAGVAIAAVAQLVGAARAGDATRLDRAHRLRAGLRRHGLPALDDQRAGDAAGRAAAVLADAAGRDRDRGAWSRWWPWSWWS